MLFIRSQVLLALGVFLLPQLVVPSRHAAAIGARSVSGVTCFSFANTRDSREPNESEGFRSCEFWMINSSNPVEITMIAPNSKMPLYVRAVRITCLCSGTTHRLHTVWRSDLPFWIVASPLLGRKRQQTIPMVPLPCVPTRMLRRTLYTQTLFRSRSFKWVDRISSSYS